MNNTSPIPAPVRDDRLLQGLFALWIAALVLALYPYVENPAGPIKLLISAVALLIIAAAGTLRSFRLGGSFPVTGLLALPFVWLVYQYLSLFWSTTPWSGAELLSLWSVYVLIAFLLTHVCREIPALERFWMVFAGAVTAASLYGFLQAAGLDPFPWSRTDIEEYRGLPATYGNPNFAGHTLVVSIVLLAAYLFQSLRMGRLGSAPAIIAALLLATQGLHLWLTHMRGGRVALLVALISAVLYVAVARLPWTPARKTQLFMVILILGCLLAFCGGLLLLQQWEQTSDTSLLLRLNGYLSALSMAADRPLLGWGAHAYEVQAPPYWTPFEADWFAFEGKRNNHVHSELIEFAVDGGLAGLLLFVLFAMAFVYAAFTIGFSKSPDAWRGAALGIALLTFLTDGLFGFNLRVPVSAAAFFLLAASIAILYQRGARSKRRIPASLLFPTIFAVALPLAWLAFFTFIAERSFQAGKGAWSHARERAATGDLEGAARLAQIGTDLARKAHQRMPWEARFAEELGNYARSNGDWEGASRYFEHARQYNPHYPGLLAALAESRLFEDGSATDFGEVVLLLDEAEALCPKLAVIHALRGEIAARQAPGEEGLLHWEAAAEAWEGAIRYSTRVRPEWTLAWAEARLKTGDNGQFLVGVERAAAQFPVNPDLWRLVDRAAAHEALQCVLVDTVLGYLDMAVHAEIDMRNWGWQQAYYESLPVMVQTMTTYGQACGIETDTLIALADKALTRQFASLDLWCAYASLVADGANCGPLLRKVDNMRQEADEDGPSIPALIQALAKAFEQTGRPTELLLSQIERALDRLPQEDGYFDQRRRWLWLADCLAGLYAEIPEERQDLRLRVEAARGAVYAACGLWEEGLATLEPLTDQLPAQWRGMALYDLARCLAQFGRLDEARDRVAQAERRMPSSHELQWFGARLALEAGQFADSLGVLTRLLPQVGETAPLRGFVVADYCRAAASLGVDDTLGVCP